MLRKLRCVNNRISSLAITLPKYIVADMHLTAAQKVDIYMKGKKIIIDTEVTTEEGRNK